MDGVMSSNSEREEYGTFSVEDLLGPLNDVEKKFAPPRLYAAGDPAFLKTGARVSIVGSRNASKDGLARARKLARALVEHKAVVVSGLALGIDTSAHRAAIEAQGRTVAVIGTPLDRFYPKENEVLQREIMRNHLCVSQFQVGYPTQPKNFPIRNRTMALMSDATVIIEAGETSGSLHQGWEALRLGRALYISKCLTEHPGLKWPAKMLAYGARVLSDETLEDFLMELPEREPALAFDECSF